MKDITAIKILKRYAKSLNYLEQEATAQNEKSDAQHYKIDRLAFEQAIQCMERSNT